MRDSACRDRGSPRIPCPRSGLVGACRTTAAALVRRFARGEDGGVAIMAAAFIAAMLLVASFAIDLSLVYVTTQRAQVIADVANLAASNTTSAVSNGAATATAVATAKNVAQINGFGSATITVSAGPSPRGDGSTALQTVIDKDVRLGLGLLSTSATIGTETTSWTSVAGGGDCVTSLIGPVNIYNYAVVKGSTCTVKAKTYLYVCGTADLEVAAVKVGYIQLFEALYICSTATVTPSLGSFTFGASISDIYASDTRLSALKSKLLGMAFGWDFGILPPVNPTVWWGSDKTYTNTSASLPQSTLYGTIQSTGSTLTFPGTGSADPTCSSPTTISGSFIFNGANTLTFGSGCYVFGGSITVNSGASAAFNVAAGAKVTFVFKGSLFNNGNSSVSFGTATCYFNYGSIYNNAGATMTFGNGSFYLWGGSLYNNSSSANLSFGTGPFYFYGGTIYNNGVMTLGDGPYYFQGGSLILNSGSSTTFGVGDVYFYGGSVAANGNALTFGNGGSASSGSGTVYMFGGSFSLTSKALTATGMTFGLYGGTVSLLGSGTFNATAPTGSSPSKGYRDVLFAIWGGTFNLYQSGSMTDTMSGMIYVPISNVSIYNNQSVSVPSNGCFQIVGGIVDIYQSTTLSVAPCRGFAGSTATSTSSGVLIQ